MLILVGDTRSRKLVAVLARFGWGRIFIKARPTPYHGEPWGFDNGAFGDWRRGDTFDGDAYLRRLDTARRVGTPAIAVCPDIVGDRASFEFSLRWRERLESIAPDWPWYFVTQDGLEARDIVPHMHSFAGLFLGGTNQHKRTAEVWAAVARRAGKRFHYGRAGTMRKLRHAVSVGADSLDSALPLWTAARFASFVAGVEAGLAGAWPQGDLFYD